MILYRARTLASRPRRHRVFEGIGPEFRVKGRWFTSDINAAVAHRATLVGETEIIAIEIEDDAAAAFCVANTPRTVCGIEARTYSEDPMTDYVVPAYYLMNVIQVEIEGDARVRDYIDVSTNAKPQPRKIKISLRSAPVDLPMAA